MNNHNAIKLINNHSINISAEHLILDEQQIFTFDDIAVNEIPVHLYRTLEINYPKFFKMDKISKLGFIAVELLMQSVAKDFDKNQVAVIITTTDGCREIDNKFEQSRNEIPSPALFVYTLPNIVVGEICIRNGFKGEQMVLMDEELDETFNNNYLKSLFSKGNTQAAIVGYINAYNDKFSCQLKWVTFK